MIPVTQDRLAEIMFPVIWHGRYFTTLCPFHDDREPSFLVYDNGAVCLAATCQRRATLTQVFNKVAPFSQNVASPSSRGTLIQWESIPDLERVCREAHEYLLRVPEQGHYLKQRRLEPCIRAQELGYWNGWITLPFFDARHNFIGLALRATPSMQAATGVRYLTPPNQSKLLYVPSYLCLAQHDYAYVVFGLFDALALAELNLPVVTGSNITGLRSGDLDAYRCALRIVPDKGEEAKADELVSGLDWRGQTLRLPYPTDCKDPADYLAHGLSHRLRRDLCA